jgi:thiol-disulfide isomerase/thioredoxin
MNPRTYISATIVTLSIVMFGFFTKAHAQPADSDRASIIAVKFHADWCGSCKAMGPAFSDLGDKFDSEPVLFVTFDLTNDLTTRRARLLAQALRLDKIWAQNAPKTGFVLLVDASRMEVLDKLTKDDDFKMMGEKLAKAVTATRAKK